MTYLQTIFAAFALLLAVVSPLSAQTVKSTTGANLGTIKTTGTGQENARLSINSSNISVEKVTYGFYGNRTYWETWRIEGGTIHLQQTTGSWPTILKSQVKKLFEMKFKNKLHMLSSVKINKIRNNLYQINYNYNNSNNCSYINYVYGNESNINFAGDKNIRITLCDASTSVDKNVVSQEALFLLGSIRHLGNKIRPGVKIPDINTIEKLGGIFAKNRYSERKVGTLEPSKPDLTKLSDRVLCLRATRGPMENGRRSWEPLPDWADHVAEAKNRGLDCDVRDEVASGNNAQPAATRSANNQSATSLPIAFQWSGVTDLSIGKLDIGSRDQKEGRLEATLGSGVGSCSGKWQLRGTNYGTWFVGCDGGISASGSYQMTGANSGTGEGIDSKGRTIKIKIGFN